MNTFIYQELYVKSDKKGVVACCNINIYISAAVLSLGEILSDRKFQRNFLSDKKAAIICYGSPITI